MAKADGPGGADGGASTVKRTPREERLATALRENLRKRKAQARARQAGDGPRAEEGPEGPEQPDQDPA